MMEEREGETIIRIRFISKKPVLRIQDVSTGSRIRIFHPGSRVKKDPGSGTEFKKI
jgi:hypothetical protein